MLPAWAVWAFETHEQVVVRPPGPKPESRNPKEARKPKSEGAALLFGHLATSAFGFPPPPVSDFAPCRVVSDDLARRGGGGGSGSL